MDKEAMLQQEIAEATERWDKDCMDQVQLKVGRKIRDSVGGEELFWEIESLVGGMGVCRGSFEQGIGGLGVVIFSGEEEGDV